MEAMQGESPGADEGRELRPKQSTFILLRLVFPSILLTGLLIGGGVVASLTGPAVLLGAVVLAAAGALLAVQAARVAYRKERYRFLSDRLVATRGGLLSDQTTELDVRNITQVRLRLPWPRYPLFKVGDLMIESAGSGSSEIELRAVRNPKRIYDEITGIMRRNGFALTKTDLLHEERPDTIGVLVECVGVPFFGLLVLVPLLGDLSTAGDLSTWADTLPGLLLPVALVIGAGTLIFLILHFLDMRRRTYRVFSDTVVYEEGFLTRNNAFFPAENLADSSTKQNIIDQILGLYDVGVSCQGSQSEVRFRRLRRGKEMSQAIDRLAEGGRKAAAPQSSEDAAYTILGAPSQEHDRPVLRFGVPPEEAWTGTLKPSLLRAVAPMLVLSVVIFPLIPFWIVLMFQAIRQALFSDFAIRPGSVRSSYKFLSSTERDFTYDKITGLVVREGPLDRLLGTVTVHLWSIGASQPLVLLHVRRKELNLAALVRQAGIPGGEPLGVMPARFGFGVWLKARFLPLLVVGLPLVTGLALALSVLQFLLLAAAATFPALGWFLYARARYARMRTSLHEHHVEMTDGLLWRDHFYARYQKIKKVTLRRYPWSTQGRIHFFVAGERRGAVDQSKDSGKSGGKARGRATPYGFALRYAGELDRKAGLLDQLLLRGDLESVEALLAQGSHQAPEAALSDRPALGNSMVGLVLLSIVLLPLVALLPLSIPLLVLVIRRRAYRIESDRIVYSSGILYRHQTTVLFDRIDTIRHNQGALNKLFGNGNVTVMTAGSSAPDLVLRNLPRYLEFHQSIQERYRARR